MRHAILAGIISSVALASPVVADSVGTMEFTRVPMSVREAGSGGMFGTYDVFKAFDNPALLAMQSRSFEVGMANQNMFGGQQNHTSLAGGWSGQSVDSGTYGLAILASRYSIGSIKLMDFEGNQGASVSPQGTRFGAVGAYQWEFLSLGAGYEMIGETLGVKNTAGEDVSLQSSIIHAGALLRLGRLDVGVAYRNVGGIDGALNAGGAINFNGFFKGTIGGETCIPMASADYASTWNGWSSAGITWNAHKYLDIRAGMVIPSAKAMSGSVSSSFRAGFTAHLRDWTLDYAFLSGGDMSGSHALALGWAYGAERPKPVEFSSLFVRKDEGGPKFMMEAKERTLAVANFEPQNVSAADSAVITDLLRNALVQESAFNVVEKANMDKVLAEQAFQQTGCTSQECAVKIGKVLNVKYLVVGSFGQTLGQYLLTMRVVDVETARAIYSDEAQGKNLAELRAGMKELAHRMTQAVQKTK